MDSSTALLLAAAAGIGIYLYTQQPRSNDSSYTPTIIVSTSRDQKPTMIDTTFMPEPIAPPPPPPRPVYVPEPVGRVTSRPRDDTDPIGPTRNFTKRSIVPPFIAFGEPTFARM